MRVLCGLFIFNKSWIKLPTRSFPQNNSFLWTAMYLYRILYLVHMRIKIKKKIANSFHFIHFKGLILVHSLSRFAKWLYVIFIVLQVYVGLFVRLRRKEETRRYWFIISRNTIIFLHIPFRTSRTRLSSRWIFFPKTSFLKIRRSIERFIELSSKTWRRRK